MKKAITLVGVGCVRANMARRHKAQGFPVTAVYNAHCKGAEKLALTSI